MFKKLMDLRPTPEQSQLVETFAALYAKHAPPERVRAAEPSGFDQELWKRLTDLGVVAMGVPEDDGGWAASLLDLVLVAEQHGRSLAPAPLIEAQVAARLLARLDAPAKNETLAAAVAGERLVTIAVRPVTAQARRAGLVPAGAVADQAIVRAGDRLLLVSLTGPRSAERTPVDNLGSMPLADVALDGPGVVVVAAGPAAVLAHDRAVDEWMALTGAALVGAAARALEIGVDYVKERKAWGVPIGSFQAIAHRLADSATAVDGARLLAYEAGWAASEEPDRAAELAAMSFAFAAETARDATYRSLHFHGGYGFMMEYDAQLYYRRARAWANVVAEPAVAYGQVADRRYGPAVSASGAASATPARSSGR
jgi:alkylation response protein AidB-like acyl-CoA dehydrogenase